MNWYALAAFALLFVGSIVAAFYAGRFVRNGGSTGTPNWDAATSRPIEFGSNRVGDGAAESIHGEFARTRPFKRKSDK